MFCSECGTEIREGAAFCHKCGTKVLVEDVVQKSSQLSQTGDAIVRKSSASAAAGSINAQNHGFEKSVSEKKKTGKHRKYLVILGAVIILAIIIAVKWEGKIDPISKVKSDMPFADSQQLPYTDEEAARAIIIDWFERHPLRDNIRIQFMNELTDTGEGTDDYLVYKLYAITGEEYGIFFVDPDSNDIIMNSVLDDDGNLVIIQTAMDQWYLEYYWGWRDNSGYYFESDSDDAYTVYTGDDVPILSYNAAIDSYAICNFDLLCLIEYDDGTEASEVGISDFAGIYGYDASFEDEGFYVDFYYSLEIGEWDGYCFSITESWRGNEIIQWACPQSLVADTLTFRASGSDGASYEMHTLTYIPAEYSSLGRDVIYIDGDETMPFVREYDTNESEWEWTEIENIEGSDETIAVYDDNDDYTPYDINESDREWKEIENIEGSDESIAVYDDNDDYTSYYINESEWEWREIENIEGSDKTIVIDKYLGSDENVVIPSTLNGKPVTEISAYAFQENINVFNVTIPESVTSLEGYNNYYMTSDQVLRYGTFQNCINLEKVTFLGDPLLNDRTFNNTPYMEKIVSESADPDFIIISNNLVGIRNENISGNVIIPDGVKRISRYAFSGRSITGVVIPDSVNYIGEYAFYACSDLQSVNIPDGVTTLDIGCFTGCLSLKNLYLPDSIKSVHEKALPFNARLTVSYKGHEFTSSDNLREFWDYLQFGDDDFVIEDGRLTSVRKNIDYVELPDDITSIEYSAFSGCNSEMIIVYKGKRYTTRHLDTLEKDIGKR